MDLAAGSAQQPSGDVPEGMDLSHPALDQVRRDLAEGETILWAERSPELPSFEGCTWRIAAPAATGAWLVVALCVYLFQFPRFNVLGPFLGVIMVVAAIAGILILFVTLGATTLEYTFQLRRPRIHLNVLTSKRAIIRTPVEDHPRKAVHVVSLYPKMLWMITREEEPNGRGNVVFETVGSQGERSFPIKFENIADVRKVEVLARSTLLPHHRPPDTGPHPSPSPRNAHERARSTTSRNSTTPCGPASSARARHGAEPPIDLDTHARPDRRRRSRRRQVRRRRPVPLRPAHRHRHLATTTSRQLADKIAAQGFVVGSVVAPVWPRHRRRLRHRRRRGAQELRAARSRRPAASPSRCANSACAPTASSASTPPAAPATGRRTPTATRRRSPRPSAKPARSPRTTANASPPRARSAGAACTRWKDMVDLLEGVGMPGHASASRPTWPTPPLPAGLQRPGRSHPAGGLRLAATQAALDAAYDKLTDALRPWTIDFHVAQNDATVHGSGTHDKTGRHCLANDPNGKLDIAQ